MWWANGSRLAIRTESQFHPLASRVTQAKSLNLSRHHRLRWGYFRFWKSLPKKCGWPQSCDPLVSACWALGCIGMTGASPPHLLNGFLLFVCLLIYIRCLLWLLTYSKHAWKWPVVTTVTAGIQCAFMADLPVAEVRHTCICIDVSAVRGTDTSRWLFVLIPSQRLIPRRSRIPFPLYTNLSVGD